MTGEGGRFLQVLKESEQFDLAVETRVLGGVCCGSKNLASDFKMKQCIECCDQKQKERKKTVDFHCGAVRNSSIC